ncbi:hypothetical protein BGZ60DRAFT_521221 [Tricladium varicosporioides]|nr:hypothetical protein BGZ60DRAFT_521221 [Hymenoscyphus varicosporioides]
MRLSTSLLVPALIGAASATSPASVYIFEGNDQTNPSKAPTLSPEQARLVLAQRLGASQYHGLGDASDSTISYINQFGGKKESLFLDVEQDQTPELVLIVDGMNEATNEALKSAWASTKTKISPAFYISSPPPLKANEKLISDLNQQLHQEQHCPIELAINPYENRCWTNDGRSKVVHLDLGASKATFIDTLLSAIKRIEQWAAKKEMRSTLILMPGTSRLSKASSYPYGIYEKSSQTTLGRRQQAEEIISEFPAPPSSVPLVQSKQFKASNSSSSSTTKEPILGVPPRCHPTLDECVNKTNSCSGHGECYKKYGSSDKGACFTCACVPSSELFWMGGDIKKGTFEKGNKQGNRTIHWGGAACQKKDISGPFWLIVGFTAVMIGLVSWGIGMLFSIGEEKLPGVIGAGVSSKTR